MSVFVVLEGVTIYACRACRGEDAEMRKCIVGVRSTRANAEKLKAELEERDKKLVADLHFDPCTYFIEEHEVE